jgi:beta-galactosidase
VLAYYDHPYWGKYAAITQNNFGKGSVVYLGALPSKPLLQKILANEVKSAGLESSDQQLAFPVIAKNGTNQFNKQVHYYFNYSGESKSLVYKRNRATDLLSGKEVNTGEKITLSPWNFTVLEEK